MSSHSDILQRLMQTLHERAASRPQGSYTTRLMDGGVPAIAKKIREEAEEVIEAADEPGQDGQEHLAREVADLFYHTMVLMALKEIDIEDVTNVLAAREGISGLEEKRRRSENQ